MTIDLFFLTWKYMKGKFFSLSPWKSKKMKEVYIIMRTRSCSRQLLTVSGIHFSLPLLIKHWFSFRDHFFTYTHSWNLCRSDSTFWFREWSCDAVLTSKGTVSFWPWELRSGHVTQAESISHWGLHWTSVQGPPGHTGVRHSFYRVVGLELLMAVLPPYVGAPWQWFLQRE